MTPCTPELLGIIFPDSLYKKIDSTFVLSSSPLYFSPSCIVSSPVIVSSSCSPSLLSSYILASPTLDTYCIFFFTIYISQGRTCMPIWNIACFDMFSPFNISHINLTIFFVRVLALCYNILGHRESSFSCSRCTIIPRESCTLCLLSFPLDIGENSTLLIISFTSK